MHSSHACLQDMLEAWHLTAGVAAFWWGSTSAGTSGKIAPGLTHARLLCGRGCLQAQQWVDEVRDKAPRLRVALYHGPHRARDFPPSLLACYDIIISTYNVMVLECPRKAPMVGLFRVRWHRCAGCFFPASSHPSACSPHCSNMQLLCVQTASRGVQVMHAC